MEQEDVGTTAIITPTTTDVLGALTDFTQRNTDDVDRGLEVFRWMLALGVIPVCILGLVGNTVSVWAWKASKKDSVMVLLFQYLGIADIGYLLVTTVRESLRHTNQAPKERVRYLVPILYLVQTLSVHCTLVIGFFRWLGVARPHRMMWMQRRRVQMVCVGVGGWCGLLTLLTVVKAQLDLNSAGYIGLDVFLQVMGFVLPVVVLLGFSINLLTVTCQRQGHSTKKRKTTMAVLCIATCSFVACPVAIVGEILVRNKSFRIDLGCSWTCALSSLGVGEIFQALNSSVNFCFYFFFASKFRPLLRQRFSRCASGLQTSARKFSTTSGTRSSVLPQPDTSRGEGRPDGTTDSVVELAEATTPM